MSAIRFVTNISLAICAASSASAQTATRRPLSVQDVDAIARLEMLEDHREFNSADLAGFLASAHPEVRRRAAMSVARIGDKRGIALLRANPLDRDTSVAATVVFAVGQLKDTLTISWFDSLLSNPRSAPTVLTEAAAALGKIKTGAAREVLVRFVSNTPSSARTTASIGEALLSIGRSTARGDIAPIVRWTKSPSEEVRWRAVWALFRSRDPVAVQTMLAMSDDLSPLVRSWAIRALSKSQADSAMVTAKAEARLLSAVTDADRRVRTEAIRALATYADQPAIDALLKALGSADSWISVSAAEGLGRIRSDATIPALTAATGAGRPCAVRLTAMQALQTYALSSAIAAAVEIASDSIPYCRLTAVQALARDTTGTAVHNVRARAAVEKLRDDPTSAVRLAAWQTHFVLADADLDVAARRSARQNDLASTDVVVRTAALRSMASWVDSTDLPMLFEIYDKARNGAFSQITSAAVTAIGAMQRRQRTGAAQFIARFPAPENVSARRDIDRALGVAARGAWPALPPSSRTLAEYRAIVERWVVPDYNGTARPTARWQTPRGAIDIELYPGDAPLGVDDFVKTMESGAIVGTEFSRVVPDFVDQQRTIRDGNILRDEVNRHRLTRANLAWASAGLDTGSPGYTLNHTPQPHNEGDFTSLGRVIRGMDAVDRIELGDRITGAKMLTGAEP
ncbi:MAG TPA: HEAT repeat domain-containing protein [Gemmatimonadaceae bacterium]|nr:HEAT repeat domain-containing protein [Gemmatimonadaceae bacterium]